MFAHYRIRFISLLLLLWLGACATTTQIREILQDPRGYDGKTVTVQGDVVNTFSLVFVKYFELNDSTGVIRVVSDKPLPTKGQRLKVTGRIHQAFSFGDQSLMVLIEGEPKTTQP